MLTIEAREEVWPLKQTFRISRGSRTEAQVVVVTVSDGVHTGRGECVPIARYDQSTESVLAQLELAKAEENLGRQTLQQLLPAGAARNALDCALWDLEAKIAGKRVWELANIPMAHCSRRPACHAEASRRRVGDAHASHSEAATTNAGDADQVETSFTISLDTPEEMATAAKASLASPIFKLKLGGDSSDLARVKAVRAAAPASRLFIDANESWSPDHYREIVPALKEFGVELIEQPFPAEADAVLETLDHPVPVCADESCHTNADLPRLKNLYEVINVKLDKTGGLTEALRLCESARQSGFKLLIGCMVCTSLGIAPARLLASAADYVDLDGPLLLTRDREDRIAYNKGRIGMPSRELWG
jgi:L-alanine-DL-glutamate epimerase-like enolase superfamily enzyme